MSADGLTDFASQLMAEAGYGRQPYFVYYHHDTDNNHVHILSHTHTAQRLPSLMTILHYIGGVAIYTLFYSFFNALNGANLL